MEGIAVFEELAKADASVAWCVWNGNTHWTAAQLSPEAAHAIHDDPDVITANNTQPSGQAHVVDGGFRLTGAFVPQIYQFAARQVGLPIEQCLYIGEDPAEVAGAQAAGMAGVLKPLT